MPGRIYPVRDHSDRPETVLGELYRREELCRTAELPFAGKMRSCPAGIEAYLTRLYGDYNRIPTKQEIEKHVFFRPFDLGPEPEFGQQDCEGRKE